MNGYLIFNPQIAADYGIAEAVIFELIRAWCAHNEANGVNIIDGAAWTFNSAKAWQTQTPFLSTRQIRNAINTLETAGLIITGNFNENGLDRRKWYAVTEAGKRAGATAGPTEEKNAEAVPETPAADVAKSATSMLQKSTQQVAKSATSYSTSNQILFYNTIPNTRERARAEKHAYGEYNNVELTAKEYDELLKQYPDANDKINNLSEYIAAHGNKYKSHYAVIRTWARKDATADISKAEAVPRRNRRNDGLLKSFDADSFGKEAAEKSRENLEKELKQAAEENGDDELLKALKQMYTEGDK